MSPAAARVLKDRYAILPREPRQGGLSVVHEGRDLQTDELVAIKILNGEAASPEDSRLFYERELESLRVLRHPNIVHLLDHGIADNQRFLILEWIPQSLREHLDQLRRHNESEWGWDTFATGIGLPLLGALEHAHECRVIHRDIKPSNVLIDADGTPKLVDFGISKLKSVISSDATLSAYQSAPYAPPDAGSQSSYSRDVFAFGLLAINSVSDQPADDITQIDLALDELNAPPQIKHLLSRCVSLNADERPPNALILGAELRRLQQPRIRHHQERRAVFAAPIPKIRELLSQTEAPVSDDEARRIIETDLDGDWTIEWSLDLETGLRSTRRVLIFGNSWQFVASIDEMKPVLTIISATQPSQRKLDNAEQRNWKPVDFILRVAQPSDFSVAERNRNLLLEGLDEFVQSHEALTRDAEELRLFGQWNARLSAEEAGNRDMSSQIPFVVLSQSGRRLTVETSEEHDESILETERIVEGTRGQSTKCFIEELDGTKLTLYLNSADAAFPRSGMLVVDTGASLSAIEKQRRALRALQNGDSTVVRSDLKDLILRPSTAGGAEPQVVEEWVQDGLDADKKEAVRLALGAPDFMLVEGPPGTGKTKFITELVAQTLRRNDSARILVVSQTHVALDNALERIAALLPDRRVIRLAKPGSTRVAPSVDHLRLENQLAAWRSEIRSRSNRYLQEWAQTRGIQLKSVRRLLILTELLELRRRYAAVRLANEALRNELSRQNDTGIGANPDAAVAPDGSTPLLDRLEENAARLTVLERDEAAFAPELKSLGLVVDASDLNETLEIEELLQNIRRDLGSSADDVSRIVQMQGEWLERVRHGNEFESALLHASSVVGATCVGLASSGASAMAFDLCILDEASKATPTESLIALNRARRWVLVGDRRQLPPHVDDALYDRSNAAAYEIDLSELPRTLFDRLCDESNPSTLRQLKTQHRMVQPIGELVSQCFYDGQLLSATEAGHPDLHLALEEPVLWVDTSGLDQRQERKSGTSFLNRTEVAQVRSILERLDFVAQITKWEDRHRQRMSVIVLSGYVPQVNALQQDLDALIGSRNGLSIDVEVNSIDKSQGREADIAIFSQTRSNLERRGGFLADSRRINVGLSRGKYGLILVGDAQFARDIGGPLSRVVNYLTGGPTGTRIRSAGADS